MARVLAIKCMTDAQRFFVAGRIGSARVMPLTTLADETDDAAAFEARIVHQRPTFSSVGAHFFVQTICFVVKPNR